VLALEVEFTPTFGRATVSDYFQGVFLRQKTRVFAHFALAKNMTENTYVKLGNIGRLSSMSEAVNIVWHGASITRQAREQLFGQRGCVIWFTGLSGSGKSTIANEVEKLLFEKGAHTFLLDGDNVRHGLTAPPGLLADYGEAFAARFGLGFSAEDRQENLRRVGAVAELFCMAGLITLSAFVSPYRAERDRIRSLLHKNGSQGDFIEIYVKASLATCESRDPKGLYQKARRGEIRGFTGIDDPYEPPLAPELVLDSDNKSAPELAREVMDHLSRAGIFGAQLGAGARTK
jgi:adenylylsulfate kinase